MTRYVIESSAAHIEPFKQFFFLALLNSFYRRNCGSQNFSFASLKEAIITLFYDIEMYPGP